MAGTNKRSEFYVNSEGKPKIDARKSGSESNCTLGPGFIRKRIILDEGCLSYVFRPGTAVTFVLLPGSFNDSSAFKDVVSFLDREMQLLIVELRGHGESWPPPKNGSIEQFALDVLKVVDEMELESFYIGGHSIGGMISLQVAKIRPRRVKGIVSVEGWTSHHVTQDAFEGRVVYNLSAAQLAKRAELRKNVMDRWSKQEIEEFKSIWRKWDGYDFLNHTDLPILELYGDRGRDKPGRDKLRIPDRDNIEVRWVENASHCLQIERPRELAEACMDFIKRIEASGMV